MKYLALLILFFAIPIFAANTKEDIHKSMHKVFIELADEHGYCTAYAVGPNTILTAAHCVDDKPEIDLFLFYEKTDHKQTATAKEVILDGNDHALVVLRPLDVGKDKFTGFSTYIQDLSFYSLQQGDKVFMYGATSRLHCDDCYKEGFFSGVGMFEDRLIYWFQLPSTNGDSGSLIFDEHDHLVGMVALGPESMTGSLGFGFTPEDLKRIR